MFKILDEALHEAYLEWKNCSMDGGISFAALAPIFSVGASIANALFAPSPPSAPTATPLPSPPTVNSADVAASQTAEQQQQAQAIGLSNTASPNSTLGAPSAQQLNKPTLLGG